MKKKVVFLIVLLVLVATSQAAILDQSQEQFDGIWLVICPDWLFAQTFTAGLTGQLEKVDISLENIFGSDLYPSTVSIVNTINGVPSGSVLGTIYADSLVDGFNSIDFLSESVFLIADTQYGIVLYNDDPDRHTGASTAWNSTVSDVYTEGALWLYLDGQWIEEATPPGGGSAETFYDKDAAFRTWMVPEPGTLLLLGLGGVMVRRKHS